MLALVQRAALAICRFDPRFARALMGASHGWSTDRAHYMQRSQRRLAELLQHFTHTGLLNSQVLPACAGTPASCQLDELPVLSRQALQELFPLLEARYQGSRQAVLDTSSGSTGEPIRFYRPRDPGLEARAHQYLMLLKLNWRPGVRRICLWGSERHVGDPVQEPRGLSGLISNVRIFGNLAPGISGYRQFLDAVTASPGCAVYGYAGLLEECARLMLERGWSLPRGAVSTAWSGAEMLLAQQRELFRQAFNVKLRDLYGSRECPWIAAECACGTRHISPRYIVEALSERTWRAVPEGEVGSLAVTDLYARCTPFIRYLIGDLGAVAWRDCACGHRGFCLTELHGRAADVIELPSGARISGVFVPHLVEKCMGVQRAQVVRLGETSFQLRYIGDQLDAVTQEKLKRIMRANFEGAEAQVVRVSELQTSSRGKARLFLDLRSRAHAEVPANQLQIA